MKFSTAQSYRRTMQWFVAFVSILLVPVTAPAQLSTYNNPSTVPLGTAGTYGVLSYAALTGTASVTGDVGSSNASVDAGITATGTNWTTVNNAHNLTAQVDLTAALTNANDHTARPTDFTIAGNLDGLTLYKGIYDGGALDLASSGTLTLSGSATDIFIIRASSTLIINTDADIVLTGGAVWTNVFWYVGTSATIHSGTTFNGSVLAAVSGTLNVSAVEVNARILANTGAVTINSAVLPVELTAFTLSIRQSRADLRWATATETNNYGYEIERTIDNGKLTVDNWSKVGFVDGAGTTNSPKNYSYTDNNLSSGTYSYRLKQIDRDGKFEYSNTVEGTVSQLPLTTELKQNHPNPFNPSTQIQYDLASATTVSMKVYNMLGETVATLVNGHQEAGTYSVRFNADAGSQSLASGVYLYRLEAGTVTMTKKFILMK